ncbi:polyisoprenoid-binding protein YceI [Actinokineospora baliensis]|uniref:YceI family protein n=1 Tax=Actinokineospora baliensis TaxID=547056 RepID=UPI00195D10F1|nr:YceI family protein [Actinokineospora baliensis]MBM7774973.1 polyisoprenoid-binding protein YceI [Actinokineospora baliensis]
MTGHGIPPGTYAIDPSRSAVRFRTRHVFGLLPVTGSFPLTEGRVTVAESAAGSTATVNRFDFGVTALPGMTGRVLHFTLEVTTVRD